MNAKAPSTRSLFLLIALSAQLASAWTRTWDGSEGTAWNTADNWSETAAPVNGDDLVFTSGNPPNQPANNNLGSLSLRTLSFAAGTFTGPLTLGGNALTLDSGYGATVTLTNGNATAGRSVVVNNPVAITGAQTWTAPNANGITIFAANLGGSGTLTLDQSQMQVSGDGGLAAWRLSGTNSSYTGQVRFGNQRRGLVLLHPQAMTGGNISLGPGNVNKERQFLYLLGSSASNPFAFGIGTGANQVQFNPNSNSSGGLLHDGTQWLRFDGSGDYTWSPSTLNIEGRVTGSTGALTLGQSGEKIVLADLFDSNVKTLKVDGTGVVDLQYGLDDTGLSGRTLRKTGAGLLILNTAASGAQTTVVGVNGGVLGVSSMNQLFGGNLDIGNSNGSGILALNGVSWSDFVSDRSEGYGDGANQWRLTGTGSPGFAARGTPLTINGSGTTTGTFNRSFTLGSGARDTTGSFYANAPVTLAQGIDLTTQIVSISAAHTGPGLGLPGSEGIVYTLSGAIADAASSTGALAFLGSGTASAESAVGELVLGGTLAHTGSAWVNINTIGPNSGRGGLATRCLARFASPSALPTGALSLTTTALLVGESWSGTAGYLFTGNDAGQTYDLGSKFLQLALGVFNTGGSAGTANAVFGSHAGKVALRNTTLNYGMRANSGTTYLYALTRDNSVLTLGASGANNDFRFVAAASEGEAADGGRTAAAMTITDQTTLSGRPIIKRGTGTLVLQNVRYTDVAGTGDTTSRFAWQIGRKTNPATPTTVQFDGAVRETATSSPGSLSAFQYQLSGGVLELDATLYPSGFAKNGTSTSGTANTVRWGDASGAGGEGGGGFAAINGDVTVTITNGAGVGNVNVGWPGSQFGTGSALNTAAALIFGSKTGDSTVRMNNDLYLGSSGSGDNTRAILVVDDTNPAKPEAIILGAVKDNTANNALTLIGDGTLVLAGNGTYNSRTRVYGGLLVLDGTLASATYGITVYSGGALGGTGTVARAISVEAGGVIAATSANSPTGLQVTGTLTVDGLIGVRLPTIAPGTYNVATASGGVTLNSTTVETLPEDFVGTAWVDGNTLKLKISSAAGPTLILVR